MKSLLTLEELYVLCGVFVLYAAVRIALDVHHPRRWGSAAFWAMLGVLFVGGKHLPPFVAGCAVIVLALLVTARQVARPAMLAGGRESRVAEAQRLGNRLFWPALLVPAIAIIGSSCLGRIHVGGMVLADPKQVTVLSLGLAAIVATMVGRWLIRADYGTPARDGARLLEAVGWAVILPQLLAALGGIFQHAGVGGAVAEIAGKILPTQYAFVAVVAYCLGMALFTICMGNAFAAFAVITGGIGLPLIVQQHHGNPAIMAAIGMLSGYCGTLVTPMAANFNIVPVMLLELLDKNAVIKAQAPIAAVLLAGNIAVMYLCVYRF
ncbi:MAG TPA: DUF979 domain-containing protein [Opitutaceae bacterium]|nr:DUF979 domain-containing protein [Opitutaceae bacterium]